jgi:hypothetical protein
MQSREPAELAQSFLTGSRAARGRAVIPGAFRWCLKFQTETLPDNEDAGFGPALETREEVPNGRKSEGGHFLPA